MKKTTEMKKRLFIFTIFSLITIMFSSHVMAAWYQSTITLPRNDWWYTVGRTATSHIQKTKVTNPTYDVVSNVVSLKNVQLSSNKTHKKNLTVTHTHTTGSRGATVKGAFRSSIINQRTNTVVLAWEP